MASVLKPRLLEIRAFGVELNIEADGAGAILASGSERRLRPAECIYALRLFYDRKNEGERPAETLRGFLELVENEHLCQRPEWRSRAAASDRVQ